MQFLDKLNYVEQELAATKGRESSLQERLLKELSEYQERYRGQVMKINELEVIFLPFVIFFFGGNPLLTHDLHLFICCIPVFLARNFSAGVP
jgi:hypothetical protein